MICTLSGNLVGESLNALRILPQKNITLKVEIAHQHLSLWQVTENFAMRFEQYAVSPRQHSQGVMLTPHAAGVKSLPGE